MVSLIWTIVALGNTFVVVFIRDSRVVWRVGRVSCSGCWEKEQGAVVLDCMGETVSHTINMVSYLY